MGKPKELKEWWKEEDRGFTTPCWIWTGPLDRGGYGKYSRRGSGRTITYIAHRYVYNRYRGEIPSKMQLDHLCRVRACVNPYHMDIVTNAINTLRSWNEVYKKMREER